MKRFKVIGECLNDIQLEDALNEAVREGFRPLFSVNNGDALGSIVMERQPQSVKNEENDDEF